MKEQTQINFVRDASKKFRKSPNTITNIHLPNQQTTKPIITNLTTKQTDPS
jgi:hypothetical protein